MSCRHHPKRYSQARRALKRSKAPNLASAAPELPMLCLGCGHLSETAAALAEHGARPEHHVFFSLRSRDVVCAKCRRTRGRNFHDVAVVVEPDGKAQQVYADVETWLAGPTSASTSASASTVQASRKATADERFNHKVRRIQTRELEFGDGEDSSAVGAGRAAPAEAGAEAGAEAETEAETETEEGMVGRLSDALGDVSLEPKKGRRKGKQRRGRGDETPPEGARSPGWADGPQLHGIANIGNSCFLNAVLQVLAHSPPLIRRMDAFLAAYGEDNPDTGFTEAIREVLEAIQVGAQSVNSARKRRKRINPKRALGYIMTKAPQLSGFRQQDAHELLLEVLRGLEEDERAVVAAGVDGEAAAAEEEARPASAAMSASGHAGFTSYVASLFSTDVERVVRCEHCQNETRRTEESLATSLGVEQTTMSGALIALSGTTARLSAAEGNGLDCDKCSRGATDPHDAGGGVDAARELRDALLTERLSRAPPLLVVHLRRFTAEMRGGKLVWSKAREPVALADSERVHAGGADATYDLFGVVAHRGNSLNRGHYTSFVRPAGPSGRGPWWFANDERVGPTDPKAVLDGAGCYLAFYELRAAAAAAEPTTASTTEADRLTA